MALHGILNCYQQTYMHFGGITCTDGAGCSRAGLYADYSDDEMARVRMCEQRKAAVMGDYSAMFQLGYSSGAIKQAEGSAALREEITEILPRTSLRAPLQAAYARNRRPGKPQALRERAFSLRSTSKNACSTWKGH